MIHWKFFTSAKNEANAQKVLKWVLDKLALAPTGPKITPYHKGGFVIAFETKPADGNWAENVLSILGATENIGRGWRLSGLINQELDVICNESNVPG